MVTLKTYSVASYACCSAHLGKAMKYLVIGQDSKYIRARREPRNTNNKCSCGKSATWHLALMSVEGES